MNCYPSRVEGTSEARRGYRVGVVKENQSDGVEGKAVLDKAIHLLFLRDSGITEV